ncbi:GGDEF and EAL domain-containing protein [Aquisalimonas lutea]|uniref:putative bifunctional diguanylate cyclase/phosphodiesterase n=1 Tax=Aquisalimonas lutea TaxID=1327750 RepID=UPI0025B34DC6|nr:GGDEF and EAL domain-containing protein [Aquisalimonas lutea]MDN3518193.1 GGDEF and EAL domain-containing protein [Aquisalimonas lutea]
MRRHTYMGPDSFSPATGTETEASRVRELLSREMLDARPEQHFDQYTQLVADVLEAPVAFISVLDHDELRLKSRVGVEQESIPREQAFCDITLRVGYLEIPDMRADERFREHPLVAGDRAIRFYAGTVLRGPEGDAVGTLCVMDHRPRTLGESGKQRLQAFAALVEQELHFSTRITEARRKIERTALWDPVTGLPRRSVVVELLERAIARARHGDELIAVAHIRFPRYDEVMGVYGREVLDYTTELISERVRFALEPGDHLGRPEEETLVAVVTGLAGETEAMRRMHALCDVLREPYQISGGSREVVVAFGVSVFPGDGQDTDTLLDRARLASRRAESTGEQAPVFFSGAINREVSRRDRIARRFGGALEREQIELHYQPVLSTRSGQVVGCEALARWSCPQLGRVSPAEFIPVVEHDPGLSRRLTHYVLAAACRQAAAWRQRLHQRFWISVNVSGRELHDPQLSDTIEELLRRHGLPPDALVIELTEQSMIGDMTTAIRIMEQLRRIGVRCAVDDFGTGYSSLNYLRQLPLDKLKIDRTFVDGLQQSRVGREVVSAIINIGHALNMTVVAEGVETPDQVQVLCDLLCDEVQGFLMRPAVPAGELEAMIAQGLAIPWAWEERDGS